MTHVEHHHPKLARSHPAARHPHRERDAHRVLRQVHRGAARARLRHHHRQFAPADPALVAPGRRHHRDPHRGRAARVHDRHRRRRGRDRHRAQPERSRPQGRDGEDVHGPHREGGPGPGPRARHPARRRAAGAEPRSRRRDARQEGPARHGAHGQRGPRLRARRAEQDARHAHRDDPDRRALLADPQGELHGHQRARRSADRLRQARRSRCGPTGA